MISSHIPPEYLGFDPQIFGLWPCRPSFVLSPHLRPRGVALELVEVAHAGLLGLDSTSLTSLSSFYLNFIGLLPFDDFSLTVLNQTDETFCTELI